MLGKVYRKCPLTWKESQSLIIPRARSICSNGPASVSLYECYVDGRWRILSLKGFPNRNRNWTHRHSHRDSRGTDSPKDQQLRKHPVQKAMGCRLGTKLWREFGPNEEAVRRGRQKSTQIGTPWFVLFACQGGRKTGRLCRSFIAVVGFEPDYPGSIPSLSTVPKLILRSTYSPIVWISGMISTG
jgi:hypothetical protein